MKKLYVITIIILTSCYWGGGVEIEQSNTVEPIYMSYSELRSSIKLEPSRHIKKTGKIYLYKNYLFINEPNKGIHVFDNLNSSNPIPLSFINIPGNVDIAIKKEILYVDSFIDLVAIDISNITSIKVVKRIEKTFDYDPYQALNDDYVYFGNIDEALGVIIGYKEVIK